MNRQHRYGWVSYYFNLLLLTPMSHHNRMRFIEGKAREADTLNNPDRRLRLLLHCTDWPIDLLQSAENVCVCESRQEMRKLQEEMVQRYRKEKLAQAVSNRSLSREHLPL